MVSPMFIFAHELLNLHSAYEGNVNEQLPRSTLSSITHFLLPAEVIVVGIVSDGNLSCSPVGTFSRKHPLLESEFELLLL